MTDDLKDAIKRKMFEMGMPTGSDRRDLNDMGVPPLHQCNPDLCCRLCNTHVVPHRGCILR